MRSKLGQIFLEHPEYCRMIVDALCVVDEDVILEIGCGNGALTFEIVKYNFRRFFIVEIDKHLCNGVSEKLTGYKNVHCFNNDIRNGVDGFFSNTTKVITNLPFYLSKWFLNYIISNNYVKYVVCMLQLDLLDSILLNKYTGCSSYIGILVNTFFKVSKLFEIDRTYFKPVPSVDTGVLKLERYRTVCKPLHKYKLFLRNLFQYKRKIIKNNIMFDHDMISDERFNKLRPHQIPIKLLLTFL